MLESFAAVVLSFELLLPQLVVIRAVQSPMTKYEEKFFIIGYFLMF